MKNNYEFYQMLRTTRYFDIIFGLALGIAVYLLKSEYLVPCLLGFGIAVISFYINGFTVNYVVGKEKTKNEGLIILSFIARIIIISAIGLVLFTYNKFNVIAYIMGYTFRFISLVSYGLMIKKK
ncbi:MAG: ATP synthase subunit I [Clostridium sp.]|nr:ATP synthase subunit I [Clostridium sp.]